MTLPRLAPRTLRGRIALAAALSSAAALAGAAFVVDDAVRRGANRVLEDSTRAEADALAALVRIEGPRLEFDEEVAPSIARFEAPKGGSYFQVTAGARAPLYSKSLLGRSLPPPGPSSSAAVLAAGSSRTSSRRVEGPYEPRILLVTLVLSVPVVSEGEEDPRPDAPRETIVVEVGETVAPVDRQRVAVREAFALALPVGVLLCGLGAFLVARRATAPVARLSEEARAIGASSLRARLEVGQMHGELRDLAETLNGAFARLSEAVARERRFAGDAAHELRTPLAVLRSRLELALSRDRSPEEYRASLVVALDAGERLERVAQALLLLARAESQGIAREPLDLRAVVSGTVDGATAAARAAGVRLALDLPPGPIPLSGDPILLDRLVANLVENAVRHGGAGGVVDVVVREDEDLAHVAVMDRGPGFPEELAPRLFDRFARGEASRSRESGGAGLGLSIARAIARAHGGDVTAGPREGGGARVEVVLPLGPVT